MSYHSEIVVICGWIIEDITKVDEEICEAALSDGYLFPITYMYESAYFFGQAMNTIDECDYMCIESDKHIENAAYNTYEKYFGHQPSTRPKIYLIHRVV